MSEPGLAHRLDPDGDAANGVDGRRPATERALLCRLLQIEDRVGEGAAVSAPRSAGVARAAFAVVLVLAGVKIALACAAGLELLVERAIQPTHAWPALLNLAVFGLSGGTLMAGGSRDRRSRQLGIFFVLTASAFADRLLAPFSARPLLAPVVNVAMALPTDAFLGVALWLFVAEFPSLPRRTRDRRLNRYFLAAATAGAAVLFAAGVVPLIDRALTPLPPALLSAATWFDRRAPGSSLYWPILFGVISPALPYLAWKSRFEPADERRRVAAFVIAFIVALAPMIVAVIVVPFVPVLADPARRDTIGVFLYASLLTVVPMTAYAVRVRRVMNVELIITAAMRHAAIRYCVWLAGIAPFIALIGYTYVHRDLTIIEVMSTRGSVVVLPIIGVLALTFRHQILQAIDRALLGAHPSHLQAYADCRSALQDAYDVRGTIAILTHELERWFHPRCVDVLLRDHTGAWLVSPGGQVRRLRLESTLGDIIRQARGEVALDVEPTGAVQRLLPEGDCQWLAEHRFELFVPLTSARGDLLGVLALGEKRSGTPYSAEDRLVLSVVAGHATSVLESRSHHDREYGHLIDPARGGADRIESDEPGALCQRCGRVWPSSHTACECGAATVAAALPAWLTGKFVVEQLIGSGGMGVVYLATDVELNRRVAIKTIPALTHRGVQRLKREARTMASLLHPNLALIYSVETWRGAPVLVVEYLEGGTLADALAKGPLGVPAALELGIIMADVLEQVHHADILHGDIKPANIGFTRSRDPKLMDFGVAHMLPSAFIQVAMPVVRASAPHLAAVPMASLITTVSDHVVGTPLYLSPEAMSGAEPDCSFDLWSLSVTLFEAASGHYPFDARGEYVAAELSDFLPDCPADVAAFFAAALARDPLERPATAREFRIRLSRIRADLHLA